MKNRDGKKGILGIFREYFKIFFLLFLLLMFFQPQIAAAATLSSTGGWTQSINSSNLMFGAGSNLANTYLSTIDATTLNVSGCISDTDPWQIQIKRTDFTWDSSNFVFSAQRTSDGTGTGIISGGTSLQVVNTTDAVFISGQGNRTGITIQYQLTGMSIQSPPYNYSTAVEFTITP